MPTYRNTTDTVIKEQVINHNGVRVNLEFPAGKDTETIYIVSNAGLTKISDVPVYNPLQAETTTVTSTGVDDDQEVDIHLYTKTVSIFNNSSVLVNAYINGTFNSPPLLCHPNTERIIKSGGSIDKLVLVFASAATVYVEQRK